jgi:hypothetical protein
MGEKTECNVLVSFPRIRIAKTMTQIEAQNGSTHSKE